jgi:hypothetical protein
MIFKRRSTKWNGLWGFNMPQNRLVDEILVSGRVYALSIAEGEEATDDHISHMDAMEGVQLRLLDDYNFLNMNDDEVMNMVNDMLPEITSQVLESVLLVRDELRIADEIVTLGERFERGEQDWEL